MVQRLKDKKGEAKGEGLGRGSQVVEWQREEFSPHF